MRKNKASINQIEISSKSKEEVEINKQPTSDLSDSVKDAVPPSELSSEPIRVRGPKSQQIDWRFSNNCIACPLCIRNNKKTIFKYTKLSKNLERVHRENVTEITGTCDLRTENVNAADLIPHVKTKHNEQTKLKNFQYIRPPKAGKFTTTEAIHAWTKHGNFAPLAAIHSWKKNGNLTPLNPPAIKLSQLN